ncbi:MAG: hypothetical protein WEB93_03435 [Sphingomonadales bacterium]
MSEVGSTPNPASLPAPDKVGRVTSSTRSHDNPQSPQQEARQQTPHPHNAAPQGAHGHHDPAVSLSASLARLTPGTELEGVVLGEDPDARLIVRTDRGIYLLEMGEETPAPLREAATVSLRIIQTDHVIEARITGVDGQPRADLPPATLTLVRIEPPAHPDVVRSAIKTVADYLPYSRPATGQEARSEASPLPMLTPIPVATPVTSPPIPLSVAPEVPARDARNPVPLATRALTFVAADTVPHSTPAPMVRQTPEAFDTALLKHMPGVASGMEFVARLEGPVTLSPPKTDPFTAEIPAINPGAVVHVRIHDLATPETQSAPTNGIMVTATVTPPPEGTDAPRQLILPEGRIALPAQNRLPVGTEVTVTLEPVTRPAAAGVHTGTPTVSTDQPDKPPPVLPGAILQPLLHHLTDWPALSTLASIAQGGQAQEGQGEATAVAASLTTKLPTPERPVNGITLLFMNLLGFKAPAQWLLGPGGAETLTRSGLGAVAEALDHDIARLNTLATERAPSEWRPVLLPIQTDNSVHALAMLIRQSMHHDHPDGGSGNTGEDPNEPVKVTRFVLDVELSAVGPIQADGIIRARDPAPEFDLILRTREALPGPAQADIEGMFARALARCGFTGSVSFRPGQPFAVDVRTEFQAAGGNGPLSA